MVDFLRDPPAVAILPIRMRDALSHLMSCREKVDGLASNGFDKIYFKFTNTTTSMVLILPRRHICS